MCNSCYNKLWREKNASKVLEYRQTDETRFICAKSKAKSRGIEWLLTIEEYKTLCNKECFYCSNQIGKQVTSSSGLDRIKNDLGYQIDNVVACCEACNRIRNEVLSSEEMKQVAQFIIELRKKNPRLL